MAYFPVFINIENFKAVVIGAGKIAARRINVLKNFGADITVIAKEVKAEISGVNIIIKEFNKEMTKDNIIKLLTEIREKMIEFDIEDIDKIISSEMVFYKIITSHKDKETIRDLKEKINKIGGLAVASTSEYDIEVNDIQAQKGLILAKVAKMKGIEKDEVMVLGDSFNDYSMFTEFKNSYAMKNAMDEIKKIATYITETNNNDGVGKAIEKVLNMQ